MLLSRANFQVFFSNFFLQKHQFWKNINFAKKFGSFFFSTRVFWDVLKACFMALFRLVSTYYSKQNPSDQCHLRKNSSKKASYLQRRREKSLISIFSFFKRLELRVKNGDFETFVHSDWKVAQNVLFYMDAIIASYFNQYSVKDIETIWTIPS